MKTERREKRNALKIGGAEERFDELHESHRSLDETLNAWRRERSLFPHQFAQWQADFCKLGGAGLNREEAWVLRILKSENQRFKHDLKRKEKALAEAAALLVLQKRPIYDEESSALASYRLCNLCLGAGISPQQIVLHSDNGEVMKDIATMPATQLQLGVMPSGSRPAVIHNNPYSEFLFKTLKYLPKHSLKRLDELHNAKQWMEDLVAWYNHEYCHNGIHFVTPALQR